MKIRLKQRLPTAPTPCKALGARLNMSVVWTSSRGRPNVSSVKHPAQMRRLILISSVSLLSGCVSAPPIVSTPSACSTLLPPEWREGVQGADLPQDSTVGDWIAFADAQTGQLDKANERTREAIGIIERCEQRDAEAVRRSRPKFLGVF